MRSLFVVGIGCDVFPGINGITPRLIEVEWKKVKSDNSLHDNEEKIKEIFMDLFIKKDKTRKLNRDVLHTFTLAFMHEPAVRFGKC